MRKIKVGDVGIYWKDEYMGKVAIFGYISNVSEDGTLSVSDGHCVRHRVNLKDFELICKSENREDTSNLK